MNEEKKINMPIIHHLVIYLISFFGLSVFYTLNYTLLNLIPSFKNLSEPTSMMIEYCLAYGLTAIALIIYLWDLCIKDLFAQFKVLKNIGMGIIFGIALIVITDIWGVIANIICQQNGLVYQPNHNQLTLNQGMKEQPILALIMSVIFAPFTEELGYRLGIFGGIKKYSRVAAYIVCALIFGLIHFDFMASGDAMLIELINLPAYVSAGLLLCFYYDYTGSLATSITAHAFNNLFVFVVSLL